MDELKRLFLAMIDEAFDQDAWYGPNLWNTLKGLSLEQATYTSTYEGYSAWKVVLHCAYWKWDTRKNLCGHPIPEFPRGPEDWPRPAEDRSLASWKADLEFLREEHRLLRECIQEFPEEKLLRIDERHHYPFARHLYGIASHDVYHTAQIRNMGIPGVK